MAFTPKPGCPMCGIVASAVQTPSSSPRSLVFPLLPPQHPEILWRDDNFTVYREKSNPVSSKGHIIIAFNLHVPSIYTLSSSDLPLLVNVRNLATKLLHSLHPSTSPLAIPVSPHFVPSTTSLHRNSELNIGFITPPFKDNKIPVTDHLHAHAYIGPPDLMGWWRGIAYSQVAWYAIDDLIAEIRESFSNNRVKSGHQTRLRAPIDQVPHAGARSGTADGTDTTPPSIAAGDDDLEGGHYSPLSVPQTPILSSPQASIARPNL